MVFTYSYSSSKPTHIGFQMEIEEDGEIRIEDIYSPNEIYELSLEGINSKLIDARVKIIKRQSIDLIFQSTTLDFSDFGFDLATITAPNNHIQNEPYFTKEELGNTILAHFQTEITKLNRCLCGIPLLTKAIYYKDTGLCIAYIDNIEFA